MSSEIKNVGINTCDKGKDDDTGKTLKMSGISDMNQYITCVLCKGYLINATTVTECLHSFCKSCIVGYLSKNKTCPICDVLVHKTKPLKNIRSDKTLQDIVYKMVPGLYKAEVKRRRQFYAAYPCPSSTSEERGQIEDRIIYSPDEKISVSLEYYTPQIADQHYKRMYQYKRKVPSDSSYIEANTLNQPLMISRRYLCCPAAVTVHHLHKFIKMKFNLNSSEKVEIIYCGEILKNDWTLMDIGYIYTWRRNGPIRIFYRILSDPKKYKRALLECKAKENVPVVNKEATKMAVEPPEVVKKPEVSVTISIKETEPVPWKPVVVISKPQPVQPIQIIQVQPKPSFPNHEPIIATTPPQRSDSSKTIAELIKERNQRKPDKVANISKCVNVSPQQLQVNNIANKNIHVRGDIIRLPFASPAMPILHCMPQSLQPSIMAINGGSKAGKIPISRKPPKLYNFGLEQNGYARQSVDINGVRKIVISRASNMRTYVAKKRKMNCDEAPVPAKVAKASDNQTKTKFVINGDLTTTTDVTKHVFQQSPVEPLNGKNVVTIEPKPSVTITVASNDKNTGAVESKGEENKKVDELAESKEDENARESPPLNSLVIVTSTMEGSKSPQLTPGSTNGSKKDDKSKDKSRKQKSLDEVVKSLASISKEAKPSDPKQNGGNTKEGLINKKSGRPFSPLDLSRKHLHLPVIPAPHTPASFMKPQQAIKLSPVSNTPLKLTATNNNNAECPVTSSPNQNDLATKSTVQKKNGAISPAEGKVSMSPMALPANMPSPPVSLATFLPNPHMNYSRQHLEMLNKYGSQFFNTAMFYNQMVRQNNQDGRGGKVIKKL